MKQEVLQYWIEQLRSMDYEVYGVQKTNSNSYNYYEKEGYESKVEGDKTNRIHKLVFVVKNKEGYIFDRPLIDLLNGQKTTLNYAFGDFNVHNIGVFLKSTGRPYSLYEENHFQYVDDQMRFHCSACGRDFYCSWSDMQKYLRNKKHNCNASYHRLEPNDEKKKFYKIKRKYYFSLSLPEQKSSLNNIYVGEESPIASQLKEYFFYKEKAILEYDECINPITGCFLPYDIFIPKRNLYIEIQGDQHYTSNSSYYKNMNDFIKQSSRDIIKKQHAEHYGTFIEIDLTEIKTIEEAISYVESFIQ